MMFHQCFITFWWDKHPRQEEICEKIDGFFFEKRYTKQKCETTAALSMVLKSITQSAPITDGQISLQISSFFGTFVSEQGLIMSVQLRVTQVTLAGRRYGRLSRSLLADNTGAAAQESRYNPTNEAISSFMTHYAPEFVSFSLNCEK